METLVWEMPELEHLIREFNRKYVESGLTYGWPSDSKKEYDYGHWNKVVLKSNKQFVFDNAKLPFIKKHPEVETIWNILQSKIGRRKLLRVYVNGYTYGTDAYLHRDDGWIREVYGDVLTETVIVYLNDEWNADWAGETVIMDEFGDIEKSILPKKNRVLVFNSNKLHAARPLTRACSKLRKVLVFKTIDYSVPTKEIDFIYKLTLNDPRLFYVSFKMSVALDELKCGKNICLSALYHAVYTYDIERQTVKDLIGESAEQLVYDHHNRLNMETKDLMYIEFAKLMRTNKDGVHTETLNTLWRKLNES
jgi:hypothetical protein